MSQEKIEDYKKAIISYHDFVLKRNAVDAFQCGSVKNPGVSDIDCIVVLKNWNDFSHDFRFFNPEFFSDLFVHGPFVITSKQLDNLYRFTTLRPTDTERLPVTHYPVEIKRVSIAVRQSWSWMHLWLTLHKNQISDPRMLLLIAKSIYYTITEISALSEEHFYRKNTINFEILLEQMRNKFVQVNSLSKYEFIELKRECEKNLHLAGGVLSEWILTETKTKPGVAMNVINDFSMQTRTKNTSPQFIDFEKAMEWTKMSAFIEDVTQGYARNGLLWRGAEFPFHIIGTNVLGWKIWLRRLIKKGAIPMYRKTKNNRFTKK